MVTIFKSHGLWKLVEKWVTTSYSKKKKKVEGSSEEEDDEKTVAAYMQDAKALGIIQSAISDQIFPRIANADSAKMAWDLLYGEYHGGDQVQSVKFQNLRREFEYTRIRDDESLFGYLTQLNELINQMKTFGEVLSNERLVQKQFLKARNFASFSVSSKGQQNRVNSQSNGLKSQKNWNAKGMKWDSKPKFQQKSFMDPACNANSSFSMNQEVTKPHCKVCSKFHFGECRYKGKSKCHNCDKFGHWARECTGGKDIQKANCANRIEVSGNLFYANCATTEANVNGNWYINSGCSNHMTGNVNLLVDVRTNVVGKVQRPTGDLVNVARMGSLVIDTTK
ncbi:unnamed protein product [Malus baccata var. baccata]